MPLWDDFVISWFVIVMISPCSVLEMPIYTVYRWSQNFGLGFIHGERLQCFDTVHWVEEGHPACKNWVVRYWRGYLSGARCKWFAYGPADATATPSSLAPVKWDLAPGCSLALIGLWQTMPFQYSVMYRHMSPQNVLDVLHYAVHRTVIYSFCCQTYTLHSCCFQRVGAMTRLTSGL